MGLAHQPGNRVTLSYRGTEFNRIKGRNTERLRAAVSGGRLELMLQSGLSRVGERSVRLETPGGERELPNDYVFIFAGGVPPTEFLEKIGVRVGPHDLTEEAAREARMARAAG